MGVIGCGSQGTGNMKNFLNTPGVRVVAVCDVDETCANEAKKIVDEFYRNSDCRVYRCHTDLIQHPGLNTVCLSTPDHWHAKIGIDCCTAKLDIYGEKPFAWGLAEGRALSNAVQKHQRVWQTGSWQRSKGEFRRFHALIQNQTLGKMSRFECGTPAGRGVRQHLPEEQWAAAIGKPPANLDWNRYCGPAGALTYHPMIHNWNWRWLNQLGGGQLLDWVGHHVDIALWSLGLDHTGPVKIEGSGENPPHPLFNTYTKYQYQGTFADGRIIEVRSDFMGTKFTGENGWIHVTRNKIEASNRDLLRNVPADFDTKPPTHYQNFIDCVRNRKRPESHAEASHRAASFGQLAIVALDLKRPVQWNPDKEAVMNDPEAAAHPRLGSRLSS